jgi:hypothetical protein
MAEKTTSFQYPINTESPRFVGNVATPSSKFEALTDSILLWIILHECALTVLQTSYELLILNL